MENMREDVVADEKPRLPSAEVVSKVLSQNSCNTTFMKNAAIEEALREELAAEKQGSVFLQQEMEELKKKTEAADEAPVRTQRQYEELKKQQEESNLIVTRLLTMNNPGISSQP
ncbi:hypothetical protein GQ55_8G093600 [Panicum hallii var. hallii]|uniref:Uncharacterized protein n=1 Tax=Panicum hallii var. hallii TaxID=1504633 RepID=A0A2T7CM64_9POAL|nr:hypothetical protein GQ55_8G093600 [Panicum hallii var. hallii]